MFTSENKENTPVLTNNKDLLSLKDIKAEIDVLNEKETPEENNSQNIYDEEILQCYLKSEKKNRIPVDFLESKQTELTISNRKTIIEWLIDYHQKCRLKQESLFLAIQIFDRYLTSHDIKRKDIQVVVVAALRVACKYCELNPIRGIHSSSWTKEELIEKENEFLAHFDYNLTSLVTPYIFLKKYEIENPQTPNASLIANFFTELSFLYTDSVNYLASEIASASFELSCEILQMKPKVELVQKNEDCKQYLIYLFRRKKFTALEKKYTRISIKEIENYINLK
eukprot:gene1972-1480_t